MEATGDFQPEQNKIKDYMVKEIHAMIMQTNILGCLGTEKGH